LEEESKKNRLLAVALEESKLKIKVLQEELSRSRLLNREQDRKRMLNKSADALSAEQSKKSGEENKPKNEKVKMVNINPTSI
jgi:hypothetical protein